MERFQVRRIQKIAVTGLAAFLLVLGGVTASSPAMAASYPCSKNQTLRAGVDNSTCVKAMQTYLNGYINAKLALDGDFGSKTTAAVKTFQRKMNLSADGVVGPNTRTAVCAHTGIPVNSGATTAQIVAAGNVVIPMCEGWGFVFD